MTAIIIYFIYNFYLCSFFLPLFVPFFFPLPILSIDFNTIVVMMLYDIDALENSFSGIKQDFDNNLPLAYLIDFPKKNSPFLHCFAIKSCPLSYILHRAIQANLGLECASIMEVKQALRCGCLPEKVLFSALYIISIA